MQRVELSRPVNKTPAYALLVGVALENKSQIQSIPLTSSPTILCKEHDTKYVNFVSLTEYSSSDGKWVEGGSSTTLRLRISADQIWASQCVAFIIEMGSRGGQVGLLQEQENDGGSWYNNDDEVENL